MEARDEDTWKSHIRDPNSERFLIGVMELNIEPEYVVDAHR